MSLKCNRTYLSTVSILFVLGCYTILYLVDDPWNTLEKSTQVIANQATASVIPIDIRNVDVSSFKEQHFYNNSIKIGVPALIISGPPKTGTDTFLSVFSLYPDTFAYPAEHFYFASPSHGTDKCAPNMTGLEWNDYINAYNADNTSLSSLFAMHTAAALPRRKCSVAPFEKSYKWRNLENTGERLAKYGHRFDPKHCINPLDYSNFTDSTQYVEYCWFFEKAPVYARRPFVAIFVANLLPKTRYLTILRNPMDHVWSNYFHFGGPGHAELTVIDWFKNISSIKYLNDICDNIWLRYKEISPSSHKKERYLLMKSHYKQLIIEYFRRRYISPKDILLSHQRQVGSKVIWSTYYLPILLIGLFVNDEVQLYNNADLEWDPIDNELLNYKWVQFEWLWGNTVDSIRSIKCWMTQGYRMNNNQCEFQRDDEINQYLFANVKKTNSKIKNTSYTDWYIQEIKQLFMPCTNLLVNAVLEDRPNLLLGNWEKWKYFE